MHTLARALLAEIEAFLAESGLTPTKFGLAAVNDGHLVANLRKGNSVTLKTADRVRAFIGTAARAQGGRMAGPGHGAPAAGGLARAPAAGVGATRAAGPGAAPQPQRRIALIIGGGIAAYKCLELIRRLRDERVGVRAIMTRAAQAFITPLSVGALTGDRVFSELFDLNEEREIGHIRLAREADLIVVAPATADLLAKMAGGHADDLASCVLLATDKPVLVAPAMNPRMWLNPATRRNVALLQADGIGFVGPAAGEMAEAGEAGPGRLSEVPELLAAICDRLGLSPAAAPPAPGGKEAGDGAGGGRPAFPSLPSQLSEPAGPLSGRHVIVTSGPTHEPIDPVRYIANRSSGKQGTAIAAHARLLGARVTLISGPSQLPAPAGVDLVRVETAQEMLAAVRQALPCDIAIFAAAVADWRVAEASSEKLKKGARAGAPRLELVENPDILKIIAGAAPGRRPPLVIGFAAETTQVVEFAKKKRKAKGADWILANDVSPTTGIMGGDRNAVHLVTATEVENWPDLPKAEVARRLVARAAQWLAEHTALT
jgi:phosphopantothenoylcysteine decarboxylase / phosphopantothenate---cysteine ligase